jgi:hypothetical protein
VTPGNVDLMQPHLQLLERLAAPCLGPLQLPPARLGRLLVTLLRTALALPSQEQLLLARWQLLRASSTLLRGAEPRVREQLVRQHVLAVPGLQQHLEQELDDVSQLLSMGVPWASNHAPGLAELQLLALVAQHCPGARGLGCLGAAAGAARRAGAAAGAGPRRHPGSAGPQHLMRFSRSRGAVHPA